MDDRTLKRGALIGSCMIVVVVFLFGFGGFIAAWSGLFQPSNRPYNSQSFTPLAVWRSMILELETSPLRAAGPDDYGNTILFTLLSNGGPPVVRRVFICFSCLQDRSSIEACPAGVYHGGGGLLVGDNVDERGRLLPGVLPDRGIIALTRCSSPCLVLWSECYRGQHLGRLPEARQPLVDKGPGARSQCPLHRRQPQGQALWGQFAITPLFIFLSFIFRNHNLDYLLLRLQDYNVISLFLLTNILNTTATIPILLGLWRGPLAQRVITPASALFGCLLGRAFVVFPSA